MGKRRRPVAAAIVAAATATGVLWGALFPGLAVIGVAVEFVVFPCVAVTLLGWGGLVGYLLLPDSGAPVVDPMAVQALAALHLLEEHLRAKQATLAPVVVQDVQGTIDDLRREVAEGPSQRRLLEIVEAADRFRHELDAPPEQSRADPVASLDLARRAFRAAQREVR